MTNPKMKKLEDKLLHYVRSGFVRHFNSDDIDDEKEIARRLTNIFSKHIMGKSKMVVKKFKPYIVRRKNGQCQVLIPLVELDDLVSKILKEIRR